MASSQQPNPVRDLVATDTGAELAATPDGVDRMLRAVRTHLGMDVAFIAQFRSKDRVFNHVDARDRTPIRPGDAVPLEQGYCQRVVDGRLPELIVNAPALPAAAALPETHGVPIGAHLSVPIRLGDGRVYGTFCCFSFLPDVSLTERDLQMMRAFADLLADQIDRDLQSQKSRAERIGSINAILQQGQPRIVYQPIYDLGTGRLAGVEGLSRFDATPLRTPDKWFADAAEVGLGPVLEARAAASALAGLRGLPPDIYLAINGSPDFILGPSLEEILVAAELQRVVLEITEHTSVADYDTLLAALAPLRAQGLRLAVDDTGAGYASMRHILALEPDLLKLDMSLTRGIDRDRKRRALASALIAFARETGAGIIAEGVETHSELQALYDLGVTRAQGYYLARPMPLDEVKGAAILRDELRVGPHSGAADPARSATRGVGAA
jgi:EAL domain-containing protein (putative c-di-GMP-specific phosphodiesterase class I)